MNLDPLQDTINEQLVTCQLIKMTVLQYQFWHLLSLLTLLVSIILLVNKDDSLLFRELGGVSTATWMILAILSLMVHQFYVLVN